MPQKTSLANYMQLELLQGLNRFEVYCSFLLTDKWSRVGSTCQPCLDLRPRSLVLHTGKIGNPQCLVSDCQFYLNSFINIIAQYIKISHFLIVTRFV